MSAVNNIHGHQRVAPLVAAAMLLGAGLGGLLDGILFHQILQWHNMLSARISPDNLMGAKVGMFWGGIFHGAVWLMTLGGVAMLFRAGRRPDVLWRAGPLAGGALLGWGLFNLAEGVIAHHLLELHHVMEDSPTPGAGDLAFLTFGLALVVGGAGLVIAGRSDSRQTREAQNWRKPAVEMQL
ncbi:DUF2243 domain-containing protein [Roseateles sp. P5_E7]